MTPSPLRETRLRNKVFEASFDIKECYSLEIIKQKLNYIHFNPCTGKWDLADMPENYLHSSAAFYGNGVRLYFRWIILSI